ncbi:MAG: hypothetical protein COZ18_07945 [Flexibacter sp. CG_4_10_14_3_um_filter_32_15]|nr:MAG: hypothetical protein COZ18_07945 [Flexibacter sp. CG_4_10_14_3_um_filter_32_15]
MNFYLFTRIKFETYKTFFRSMFNQIFSIKQLKMGISQPNQKELLNEIFNLSNPQRFLQLANEKLEEERKKREYFY